MAKQIDNNTATEQFANVQDIKKGTFVMRKADATKVFTRGDYDAERKGYYLNDTDDISRQVFVKRGTKLFTGFTY